MRRTLIGLTVVAVVIGLAGFGLAQARPDLLRRWISRLEGTVAAAEIPAKEPPEPGLEEGPDDGWCARMGLSEASGCIPSLSTIRLASAEIAAKVGLETAVVEAHPTTPTVGGNAEIAYATHDTAEVRPRVAGRIARVHRDEGEVVKKGDILLEVDSAEVGTDKALYLAALPSSELARKEYERHLKLQASGAASEKEVLRAEVDVNRAEADLLNARQKLKNLGLTDADLAEIARSRDTSSLLHIIAPQDGTLVERHAVQGEAVEANTQLYIDTNLNHVWCWIDVYESDISRVRTGQVVRFTISGTKEPVFSGVVELVGFSVDPITRTIRVRSELVNTEGRLLANQYGHAEIQVGPERRVVFVPRAAVQSRDGTEFVFLPQGDGLRYRTQRIETKPSNQPGMIEVAWGLEPGATVVTTGSFLLQSELFRSDLAEDE